MLGIIFLLLIVGMLLLFIEGLVPGGLLGAFGVGLIILSAYLMGTEYGFVVGGAYLGGSVIAALALVFWSFHFFARRMRLKPPEDNTTVGDDLSQQIGKEAIVVSALRPTGRVEIDCKRFPAQINVSHQVIEKGTTVRVMSIKGNDLVVEANGE